MPDGNSHIPSLAARSLVAAVITQAMRDATSPDTPLKIKEDAERFLSDDVGYPIIASAAGLNPKPPMTRR